MNWTQNALQEAAGGRAAVQFTGVLSPPPSGWMMLYAVLHLAFLLWAGTRLLRSRDL